MVWSGRSAAPFYHVGGLSHLRIHPLTRLVQRPSTLDPCEIEDEICASAPGFSSVCLPNTVMMTNFTRVLPQELELLPKSAVIAGKVVLGNNTGVPCFIDRPAFRTLVRATITVEDQNGQTVGGPVTGNGVGEYVLPSLNLPPGQYRLVASARA